MDHFLSINDCLFVVRLVQWLGSFVYYFSELGSVFTTDTQKMLNSIAEGNSIGQKCNFFLNGVTRKESAAKFFFVAEAFLFLQIHFFQQNTLNNNKIWVPRPFPNHWIHFLKMFSWMEKKKKFYHKNFGTWKCPSLMISHGKNQLVRTTITSP